MDLNRFGGREEADAPAAGPERIHDGTPARVGLTQDDLLSRYASMLGSEDVDADQISPDTFLREVAEQVNAASKRPQTSTIVRLVKSIQSLGAYRHQELQAASAALARELARSDNALWNELEGEDDALFAAIGTRMDSLYG